MEEELKDAIDGIEKRLEKLDEEETYLKYSLKHLEQLFKDVQSGKTILQ